MLLSLAFIFLFGMTLGGLFERFKLPALLGMLLTGILLGPYVLQLLDEKILLISPELRKIALIIILTRAGLNLDVPALKKAGRPAALLCFVPACFEIAAVVAVAPALLGITVLEAAILGSVIAAVSPAVIVPKMLKLQQEGKGFKHSIPQMIMAGASVDDVLVIVLFTCFTQAAAGGSLSGWQLLRLPISLLLGAAGGIACGVLLAKLFVAMHLRDSAKVLLILSISFLFVTLEDACTGVIGFSGLIAVMVMGISLQSKNAVVAQRLSAKYTKLWVAAELLLFVLVGASVPISYAMTAGVAVLAVLAIGLLLRMAGVFLCFTHTELSRKEKLFCMVAYCPKATVQAAIGAIPLGMGLACGELVLTVAVLAILITAPLGAFGIDRLAPRCLDE